jgi:hypothetical protein
MFNIERIKMIKMKMENEMEKEMEKTFSIPTNSIPALEKKLKKVNKIATKLGVSGYTIEIIKTEMAEVKVSNRAVKHSDLIGIDRSTLQIPSTDDSLINGDIESRLEKIQNPSQLFQTPENLLTAYIEVSIVKVTGEVPVVGGYAFVGVIGSDKISRSAPNENIPARLLKRVGFCDHCNTNRTRASLIVVRKNEEYKGIGSSCVKDFLGTSARDMEITAQKLADLYEFFNGLDLWSANGQGEGDGEELIHRIKELSFLTYVMIQRWGWVSIGNQQIGQTTTANQVSRITHEGNKDKIKTIWNDLQKGKNSPYNQALEAEENGLFDDAIEWAKNHGIDNNQDYLRNLSIIAERGYARDKEFNLACSLIASYLRHMEKEIKKAEKVATFTDKYGNSQFQGETGTKITATVEVLKITRTGNAFGPVEIIKMGTHDGNLLTWFSSSNTPVELNFAEKKASIKCTIKGTNEYNGFKETIVTRVKVIS